MQIELTEYFKPNIVKLSKIAQNVFFTLFLKNCEKSDDFWLVKFNLVGYDSLVLWNDF